MFDHRHSNTCIFFDLNKSFNQKQKNCLKLRHLDDRDYGWNCRVLNLQFLTSTMLFTLSYAVKDFFWNRLNSNSTYQLFYWNI